ncbi:MAG: molybdopterin molybdotransferase MoeA [Verrucomicrobia bacterium]|nr:molybdopterin molybdotransferase MoeA [Verrucomicrobiota bacterium]
MISVDEAFARILEAMPPAVTATLPLEAAAGRFLREEIRSDRDAPPFDRVMLDGVALCLSALNQGRLRFRVAGFAPAGAPPPPLPAPALARGVMTRAPQPAGAGPGGRRGDLDQDGDWIEVREAPADTRGVHHRASQARAGEVVLEAGSRLDPAAMAVLATEGHLKVRVSAPPRIVLITTGDEVVPVDALPLTHQIRASHPLTLQSLFAAHGYRQWAHDHVRDEKSEMKDRLRRGLEEADILLITGGVSKGSKDWVPELLEALGVGKRLHGVAQRPGKPLWFGLRDACAVFALPGNPLSALTCARRYVLPALEQAASGRVEAPLRMRPSEPPPSHATLTTFPLAFRENGTLFPRPAANSGALHAAARSAGFLECPPGETIHEDFAFYPWGAL